MENIVTIFGSCFRQVSCLCVHAPKYCSTNALLHVTWSIWQDCEWLVIVTNIASFGLKITRELQKLELCACWPKQVQNRWKHHGTRPSQIIPDWRLVLRKTRAYRSIDTFIGATETFLLTECDFYNSCKDNAHNDKFATYASENFLYSLVRPPYFVCQLSSSKPFKSNRYRCEHDRMFFQFEIYSLLSWVRNVRVNSQWTFFASVRNCSLQQKLQAVYVQ